MCLTSRSRSWKAFGKKLGGIQPQGSVELLKDDVTGEPRLAIPSNVKSGVRPFNTSTQESEAGGAFSV